jgi:hypothetical protein
MANGERSKADRLQPLKAIVRMLTSTGQDWMAQGISRELALQELRHQLLNSRMSAHIARGLSGERSQTPFFRLEKNA